MADDLALAYISCDAFQDEVALAIQQSDRLFPPSAPQPATPVQQPSDASLLTPRVTSAASSIDSFEDPPTRELRFSSFDECGRFIVGSSSNCHLVLRGSRLGEHNFSLTFDKQKRLILQVIHPRRSITVEFGGRSFTSKGECQYVLNGYAHLKNQVIKVILPHRLCMSIEILCAEISSDNYLTQVLRFADGTSNLDHTFNDFTLHSRAVTNPPTTTPALADPTADPYITLVIGKGAFGVVTRFWNIRTGDCFVRKEPQKSSLTASEIQLWNREADMLARCDHPHIVRFIRYNLAQRPQLDMEFAPGGSLRVAHEEASLSRREVTCCTQQALLSLVYLHQQRISHRDLKPDNFLVFRRENGSIFIKLGDFGLAKEAEQMKTFLGSPQYIAPELYKASADGERYGHVADVWSLGIMAYEYLYDLPPFTLNPDQDPELAGKWYRSVVAKMDRDRGEHPGDALLNLISRMLVLDPDRRLTAMECYVQILMLNQDTYDDSEVIDQDQVATPEGRQAEEATVTPQNLTMSTIRLNYTGGSSKRKDREGSPSRVSKRRDTRRESRGPASGA